MPRSHYKLLFSAALLGLSVALLTPASALAGTCSCTAPDGSCSARITCTAGCIASCGINGNCTSRCSGGGGEYDPLHPALRQDAPARPGENLATFNIQDATDREIVQLLHEQFGLAIDFRLPDPEERLSIDAVDVSPRDLLQYLATRGLVTAGQRRPVGPPSLDQVFSVQMEVVTPSEIAAMLSSMLRTPVQFDAPHHETLSIDMKEATVGDLVSFLQTFGRVTLPEVP